MAAPAVNHGHRLKGPVSHQAEHLADVDELAALHFDPWLTCKGEALRQLADEVFEGLPFPSPMRRKAPRVDVTNRRRRCVHGILANVVSMMLSPASHDALATPLRNPTASRTRYEYSGYSIQVLAATIKAMRVVGYLVVIKGAQHRHRTRILPTRTLSEMLAVARVGLEDVGREAGEETIILRLKRPERPSQPQDEQAEELDADDDKSEPDALRFIDYTDTPETLKLRQQMETINDALNQLADVRFDGKPILPIHLVRFFTAMDVEPPHGFDLHGRLYRGGFWLTLSEKKRHLITINGEQVADLDYSSMFFRLAYIKQGVTPPEGDLYAIEGLEAYRPAVKQLVASLFSKSGDVQRMPRKVRKLMPPEWTMPRFVEAMTAKHPAIAPLFGAGMWFKFAHTESTIMVDILLRLTAMGIPALPMHDGLMVGMSYKAEAARIMREVSRSHLGVELPVSEKQLIVPT
ncbi:hypothetical protein QE369_004228 [Agrobacterium larrymoorei]|uniref:Uncharacterized protein n=1 Tax=Agrobacterium larrymoorei TaxID=160699 RepID=A0AAJ2BJA9_9HYPH|nr:hypothetical protein [Agrobacterium larrymoorei]MDR6104031.1 hypothetical protein [Agrobacterium larrymoorei]